VAGFGADRLGQADLVRVGAGQQWAGGAEQLVGVFSGTAVEHLADDVLAVDDDGELDLFQAEASGGITARVSRLVTAQC